MNFIEFDPQKCDECYKCLRVCPTKAIAFTKESRNIIDDRCIKCGMCQMECQSGALSIHLDINKVRQAIGQGKKVVATIAPSYAGVFTLSDPLLMVSALKELGFSHVEETAHGAELVSLQYEKEIIEGNADNIITSCCPSSNYLIEHYYPQAIDSVIKVVSPMIAHGMDLKSRYGSEVFVVFIGPCLAKKAEADEFEQSIDAVITFRELEEWMEFVNLSFEGLTPDSFDCPATMRGKSYPLGGSLWKSDMQSRINPKYKYIHVDGIENCKSFLSAVSEKKITGYCAELNICSGSCLNGPDMPKNAPGLFERMSRLQNYAKEKTIDDAAEYEKMFKRNQSLDLGRQFTNKSSISLVKEADVKKILVEMGKDSEADQLNCGACGYSTCYDKAVAVTEGYSDKEMCFDRLRKNAENMRSAIFENSPNAICIIDDELRIREVNPSFNHMFNSNNIKVKYWPIQAFIQNDVFDELGENNSSILGRRIYINDLDKTFLSNFVKLENNALTVGIFTDITIAEKNQNELRRVKEETIRTCQDVIDKQMRVVQEIASLLGETTAETKIGLNQLKNIVLEEGDFQ